MRELLDMAGGNLDNAKKQKADEFYTQLSDIERELKHYKQHFKNKTVFCNCDDPETSNFYYYFVSNFEELNLKKLITTHFSLDKPSYMLEYEGGANVKGDRETVIKRAIKKGTKSKLKQNFQQCSQCELFVTEPVRSYSGDFRSPECIELLKQSDIVVTNPPFSLFREYIGQLMEYDKKFIVIGSKNAITYKEIFRYIKDNKMWLGFGFSNGNAFFKIPKDNVKLFARGVYDENTGLVKFRNVSWFTNLDFEARHEDLVLYKKYNNKDYPKYDNYNAIEVSKVNDIPIDYTGQMGVPITFLDKYNPEQFDIIGFTHRSDPYTLKTKIYTRDEYVNFNDLNGSPIIKEGNKFHFIYMRVIIKHKERCNENRTSRNPN